jgi:hypothetical protein
VHAATDTGRNTDASQDQASAGAGRNETDKTPSMKKAAPYVAAICVAALLAFVSVRMLTGPSDTLPVFPPTAKNLPRVELADLVTLVLPPKGFENLGWDYLANARAIAWQTQGVETDNDASYRRGIVRVGVSGKTATVLHQIREELAWTLTLGTDGNEKFGPKSISIQIGAFPDDLCFGTLFDGCTFDAQQAIASVKSKLVCRFPVIGDEYQVYSISTADKDASLLVYHVGRGSGGVESDLEIRPLSDQSKACNPDAGQ